MLFDPLKKEDKKLVFVYTTCATRDEARRMILDALDEKLIVCAEYWAVESLYPWNGVLEDIQQYIVLFTTQKNLSENLSKFLIKTHPYNIPMVAEADVDIKNQAYALWAQNILKEKKGYISMDDKKRRDEYEAEGNFHPGHLK